MNKKTMVAAGMVVLSLALTTGFAFAASDSGIKSAISSKFERTKLNLSDEQKTAVENARKKAQSTALASLAADGTITQEQSDAITNGHENKAEPFGGLTEEQLTAIKEATQAAFEEELTALVSEGTIDQATADEVQKFPAMGLGNKVRGYFGKENSLDLTVEQKTAVENARKKAQSTALASLAADGTITQEQSDTITNGHENKAEPFGGLTEEQLTAIKEATQAAFEEELAALVSEGTIDQTTADELQKSPMRHINMEPGHNGKSRDGETVPNDAEASI